MNLERKVAFLAGFSGGKIQQVLRGALRFAEARPLTLVRIFGRQPMSATGRVSREVLRALRDWSPDGLLVVLDSAGLEPVLKALGPTPPPVVDCCVVRPFPSVTQVIGSMPDLLAKSVEHFQQMGLRSFGFVSFEEGDEAVRRLRACLLGRFSPAELDRMLLHAPVKDAVIFSTDAPVTRVQERLAAWLRGLPKPVGVLAADLGGGGYLLRVCEALGLRVPEDVAVIGGSDDADACLAQVPPLTSIGIPGETLGFEAMTVLARLMAGDTVEKFILVKGVELHVRQSTGQRRAEICDIAAATGYIRAHACRGLHVREVIKATQSVSPQTFHTHFQAATGMTPGEAIRARHFEEARRLLAGTDLSMSLVAEMSGFSSSNDFARAFRAHEGITPTAYRQRERRK